VFANKISMARSRPQAATGWAGAFRRVSGFLCTWADAVLADSALQLSVHTNSLHLHLKVCIDADDLRDFLCRRAPLTESQAGCFNPAGWWGWGEVAVCCALWLMLFLPISLSS